MPNVLELTEVVSALAKSALPGAKLLEEVGPKLSLEATKLLEQTGAVTTESGGIPAAVRQFLGEKPGSMKSLLMVGKPLRSDVGEDVKLAIYSDTRNIYMHGDNHMSVVTASPAGNMTKIESLLPNGEHGATRYTPIVEDEFRDLTNPFKPGDKAIMHVRTTGSSREVEVGFDNVREPSNFSAPNSLLNRIKASSPVDVNPALVKRHVGDLLQGSGPIRNYVAGFDASSGEALVGTKGLTYNGPIFGDTEPKFVASLDGLHKVDVQYSDGINIQAVRDAKGATFQLQRVNRGFILNPTEMLRAQQPSEVILENGNTLARELGLPQSAGLRAQGGYLTERGSRLAI